MMAEKEDLGLSLSLCFSENRSSMVSLSSSPFGPFINPLKTSWINNFPSSDPNSNSCRVETRSFLKGIDVNRSAATDGCDDDYAGVSSPNSTISSVTSGKRSEREATNSDDFEIQRTFSRGISDEEEEEDGETCRKKLRLSKDQSAVLEDSFNEHNTLNPKQKMALAKRLGLRPRQVEVWFQNRRARTKLKQTEVDCELLKRCCENLAEENRRLQREVQELRALKLSPHFFMQMTPPTTLTMCPSCERVAVPPSTAQVAPGHHPRGHPVGSTTHQRPISLSPWAVATTSIPHRPSNGLHT